jgi:AcrR family transcriptional regulator
VIRVNSQLYCTVNKMDHAARLPRTDPDERRDHIIRVARAAFLEDGYAATSMNSIANRVGGSKATLYYYFPSKEELFAAAFTERTRELEQVLFDDEMEKLPLREALTILGERAVRWALHDDSVATFRLITAEAGRFPELGPLYFLAGPNKGKQLLADFIARAVQRGQVKPGSTMTMAITFVHVCLGELQHRKLWNLGEPTGKEIEASVANGVNVFVAAYGM